MRYHPGDVCVFVVHACQTRSFISKSQLSYYESALIKNSYYDVASVVGDDFKNVGVLSFESSLFHLFHYIFLQLKHHTKGY